MLEIILTMMVAVLEIIRVSRKASEPSMVVLLLGDNVGHFFDDISGSGGHYFVEIPKF